jgi:drug/metabolite transporter (DMT)-like permease
MDTMPSELASTAVLSSGMVAAVLVAAAMHATWNAIAHGIGDRLVGFALIGVVDVVVGGAIVAVTGLPPTEAWPFIVVSAVTHVGYNVFLMISYQLGDFSQTYPLARGISPVVVAAVSILLLHRVLTARELIGICLISAGLVGLVVVGGIKNVDPRALGAACVTGIMIATYTVVDGLGVERAPLFAYTGWMFLLQGPALPAIALLRRRGQLLPRMRRHLWPGLLGGVIQLAAYAIVLWAQTSGMLAAVAALRESSIVFGAVIGAVFFGERLGHHRTVMAVVVLFGVIVLST